MIRQTILPAVLACLLATPIIAAETKAESCGYQADLVAEIQKARLNKVRERDVPTAIAATNPTWPEAYNNAIPLITPWVYEKKRKVLKNEDLSAAWKELCLQQ
jgi:hypothetical protein